MEVEGVKDELAWLQGADPRDPRTRKLVRFDNVRTVTLSNYRRRDQWILDGVGWRTNKTDHSIPEPNTFIIQYINNTLNDEEILKSLFDLIIEHKIQRVIFSHCRFNIPLKITPITCIEEVIFSYCDNPELLFDSFLWFSNEKLYKLRTITLRATVTNVNNALCAISNQLSGHFLQKIRLINPKQQYEPPRRLIIEELDKILQNNRLGYQKCKSVCLAFLLLKKNRSSSFFRIVDQSLVKEIVETIWNSRYHSSWYV